MALLNRIVLSGMLLVTLQPYSTAVPNYTIGVLSPTAEELVAMDPSGIVQSYFYGTVREAISDANARFGKTFTLQLEWLRAPAEHNTSSVSMLDWLSSSWPPIAVVGPFHVGHVKSLLPLAQFARIPLVSPVISRSRMSDFLLSDSSFAVSMEPQLQTYGKEVFSILKYYDWKNIALITSELTTQPTSASIYEGRVAAFLSLSPVYDVNVLERVRIPLWFQHKNNRLIFEEKIRDELMRIVDSGVTVIVLSIEAEKETYAALFRIANDVGLVNKFTAWIALRFPMPQNPQAFWFELTYENVSKFMNGLIITRPDLTSIHCCLV